MVRIVRSPDCGNSPKNALLERLAIAIATRDTKLLGECVTDDVEWTRVGGDRVTGKVALTAALERAGSRDVEKLTIEHVVNHGKAGAVNGTVEYRSGRSAAFCDVYEFASVKGTAVARIASYVIEL